MWLIRVVAGRQSGLVNSARCVSACVANECVSVKTLFSMRSCEKGGEINEWGVSTVQCATQRRKKEGEGTNLFRVEEKVAVPCGPNVVEKGDEEGLVELENGGSLAHDLPHAVNPEAEDRRALVLVREVRRSCREEGRNKTMRGPDEKQNNARSHKE